MTSAACPDEATLVRIALGERTDAELAWLETHLDGCADCGRVLAAASGGQTAPPQPGYPAFEPGDAVGRYTVEGLLGVGGMGIVYAARDPSLGRPVALKVLRAANDATSDGRLAREAQAMARLSHPNVVSVFELGEWQGRQFLAMELVDGVSLSAWRKAQPRRAAEVLAVMLEAGRGLAAAHAAGMVHRDFKPGNVLVGRDGRARVTDFGLARARPGDGRDSGAMLETQAGAVLGTPAYMSPEQLDGRPVDARSDQFSFCVTVAEALSGERPFAGPTREALRAAMTRGPALDGVPRRFRSALERGLAVDPTRRFPTLAELFAALETAQRRPRLAAAVVLGLVTLAGAGWALRPPQVELTDVVVATVDIPEGAVVTLDMVAQRKVPAQLVTSSVVRPDSFNYVLGQQTLVAIQARDMLLWYQFTSYQRRDSPPSRP